MKSQLPLELTSRTTSCETGDGTAGYMIEAALDTIRSEMWPANLDLPPRKTAQ